MSPLNGIEIAFECDIYSLILYMHLPLHSIN